MLTISKKTGMFKETKKAGVPGAIPSHPNVPADVYQWLEWVKAQFCSRANDVTLRNVLPRELELKEEVRSLELQAHSFYGFKCAVVGGKGGYDAKGVVYVTPNSDGGFKTMSYKQALYVVNKINEHAVIMPLYK